MRSLLQSRLERIQDLERQVSHLLADRQPASSSAPPPTPPTSPRTQPLSHSPPLVFPSSSFPIQPSFPPTPSPFVQREMQGAIAKLDAKLQQSRIETDKARGEAKTWKDLADHLASELGEARSNGGAKGAKPRGAKAFAGKSRTVEAEPDTGVAEAESNERLRGVGEETAVAEDGDAAEGASPVRLSGYLAFRNECAVF